MHNIIIGTAGHVDHGKSSLIRALTGVDCDRLDEEKKRGITIELGFAYLDLPEGGRAGIIDVPGHERFIGNMLAGAAGMDLVLLIVAADEGVMPQTREHLEILSLLGIKDGIIVLNKADLVDEEWLELAKEDVRAACQGSFLAEAPIFAVSAKTGAGIEKLREAIFEAIAAKGEKDLLKPFRLAIDRSFVKEGFGLVVTGTCLDGRISKGETVELLPEEAELKVRSIQVHGNSCDSGEAGQRLALNLTGDAKEEVSRGKWLAEAKSLIPSRYLEVALKLLPSSPFNLKSESQIHFHYGSAEQIARIILYGPRELEPGQEAYARINLTEAVVMKPNDPFVLRFYSPLVTIAGGLVIDPFPPKRSLSMTARREFLDSWREADALDSLYLAIDSQSSHFYDLRHAAIRAGFKPGSEELQQALENLLTAERIYCLNPEIYISDAELKRISKQAELIFSKFHSLNPLKTHMRREEAKSRLFQKLNIELREPLLKLLVEKSYLDTLDDSGEKLALKGYKPERSQEVTDLENIILKTYERAGFEPAENTEILAELTAYKNEIGRVLKEFKELGLRDINESKMIEILLDDMTEAGLLVHLTPSLKISSNKFKEAKTMAIERIQNEGSLKLGDFRDAIGSSRKYAIAILEELDRKKITKLRGEARVLVAEDLQ
ncbi:MAG: selenocysteine-specific translation elongation factor [Eubacteriales bacterium]|nr:selenocysteine-specific translation elongation factor [Eubacteriales bacterium]